jgi:arginase
LRESSSPLLEWLSGTGCTRVAIHLDVDVVDSNDVIFGLGAEPGGLTSAQAHRLVRDISSVGDVVGLTIAEFVPRQVIRLRKMLEGLPLVGANT